MYQSSVWNQFDLYGRKIIALAIIALLTSISSSPVLHAQMNMPKHDKKIVHFGISLGFNRANFAVTHSDRFIYHDTIKVVDSPKSMGFNVGIVSDLHLGNHGSLRFIPTLVFAEKDLRYTETSSEGSIMTNKTIESIILQFPLTYKYKSDRFYDNFRFYALGGARFDWDLGSNSKARRANDIVKISSIDYSLEYGLGLEFYFPLFIFSPEIKFTKGIGNLHVPTDNFRYSDVLDKLRSQYLTISFQFEG